MAHFDVFNGDADGLCALQQLRLTEPLEATLVTGVKRDIALLTRVQANPGDSVTVLDVSLDKNREPLLRLLKSGVRVRYFDHHFAGHIPRHRALEAHIGTLPDQGTSLLVDAALGGRYRAWALVGTFGDSFDQAALRAAAPLDLDEAALADLRELGICLNYNGYGERVEDLHFPPDALFRRLAPYADPLEFMRQDEAFATLRLGFSEDMEHAAEATAVLATDRHALYILPAEPWARRVGGVLANDLAHGVPDRAHALLTKLPGGGFMVSVRAPLIAQDGADTLCRQFPTGGGRKAAAGINCLAETDYDAFVQRFLAAFR
jgi:hypothetical protein